jgi:hypothetical protein
MTIHGAVVMDFFVHSAIWLDSYHNPLEKKKPEESGLHTVRCAETITSFIEDIINSDDENITA